MSSFKMRARRIAFGDSTDDLSDTSSTHSSTRSHSHSSHKFGFFRHSSSISEACTCQHEKSLAIPVKTTRTVRRIHRSRPFENFVEALEADGCVVVEDFVNPQISQRVADSGNVDLQEDERLSRTANIDVNELIRDSLLSDSLYQLLSTHFLALETVNWHGKRASMRQCKPQVSVSDTIDMHQEQIAAEAELHREDSVYHKTHAPARKYDYQSRRDANLGLFVPETDSLSASVLVKVLPGSHLWSDSKPDLNKGVKEVHLHGGDALILLGSLYHQAGSDRQDRPMPLRTDSGTPKQKLMHSIWMASGIYRPVRELIEEDDP